MKKTWLTVGAIAVASALLGSSLVFDRVKADGEKSQVCPIYVINVNKVFQNYTKFTRLRDDLKTEIEGTENKLRATEGIIKGKIEAIGSLTKQADKDKLEKEIADLKFQFEKDRRSYQNSFLKKEADLYGATYREMSDLVTEYCKKFGIYVVLRLKQDQEDGNPQTVLQTLSKEVVYFHPNLDLTEAVTKALNSRAGEAAPPVEKQ